MQTQDTKIYRSVKLSDKELAALSKKVATYPNRELAAEAMGLKSRNVLSDILSRGSGRGDSIDIVKKFITAA